MWPVCRFYTVHQKQFAPGPSCVSYNVCIHVCLNHTSGYTHKCMGPSGRNLRLESGNVCLCLLLPQWYIHLILSATSSWKDASGLQDGSALGVCRFAPHPWAETFRKLGQIGRSTCSLWASLTCWGLLLGPSIAFMLYQAVPL